MTVESDIAALFFDQRIATLLLAETRGEALFLGPDGSAVHDSFDMLDYVGVAGATGLDVSEAGVLKLASASGMIAAGLGTPFGDMVATGGLGAAFNGNTDQANNTCAAKSVVGTSHTFAYIGKNFSAAPQKIGKVLIYGSNNSGYVDNIAPTVTATVYGKHSAPTDETDGTVLGSIIFTDLTNESAAREIASSDLVSEWEYAWVLISHDGTPSPSNPLRVAEVQFFPPASGSGFTVASHPVTAAVVPASIRCAVLLIDPAGLTLNTDLVLSVSRDGGTSWTTATLVERYLMPGDVRVLDTGDVDVTGQPSGTDLVWRVACASATAKVDGISLWAKA